MNENKKIIASVIAVLVIVVTVAGGTYAYWRWTSNTTQQTTVAFTVDPGLSATLNGGSLSVTNLAPVASCTNSTYATKASATLTYSNNSGATAVAKGTLTVTTFTVASGRNSFQTDDLTHLHYALTTNASSCSSNVITSGNFEGKGSSGSVLFSDVTLKSGITTGTTNATQPLYLYVWLDKDYEFTNTGSQVKDPMQNLTIKLTWTGSITNSQA